MTSARRVGRRRARPVVLASLLVITAACGSSSTSDTTAATTTTVPALATTAGPGVTLTGAPTTAPPAATSTAPPTAPTDTTTAPTRCTEQVPSRPLGVDLMVEASLAAFRRLAATPAITLDVRPPELPGPEDATVSVQRIPGGLLVLSHVGSFPVDPMPATPTTITALDWDGTVRWVRCLAEPQVSVFVAPSGDQPDAALVGTLTFGRGGARRSAWTGLSLADGREVPEVADRFAALAVASELWAASPPGHWLLLQPEALSAGAGYALVDLVDLRVTPVEPPPVADASRVHVDVTATGDVVAWDVSPDGPVVASWRNGRWTAGSAGVDLGPRVAFVERSADPRGQLSGIDDDGAVRWTVPGRVSPGLQGTGIYVDDDTAIAQTCEPVGDGDCTHRLTAVDVATGTVRWELPGIRLLAGTPAGGVLLVSDGTIDGPDLAWQLVESRTGRAVPGQRWTDGAAFSHPCCGASEYDSTERHGAVMIVVEGRSVRVWLPADTPVTGWTRRLG